jgi:gliding motility-associated-like protein
MNFTDIQSMQYNINYDASILSFSGAQNFNAALSGWGAASITNPSPGILTVNWSTTSGVSLANGQRLVRLCFDVIGNTTSDVTIPAPITIQNGDGVTVPTNTNSGTVTINPPVSGFALILADATANTGDNVCLPMTVADFNNILGMQLSMNYNPAELTYTGAQNFNPGLVGWTTASIGNPTPGNLTTTWNDPFAAGVTLPNGAILVELCFDVLTTDMAMVSFSGSPTPIEIIDADEMEVPFTGVKGTITVEAGEDPGTFAATLSTEAACNGESFCMDLTASTFTNIQGMQFSITYNSTEVSFAQINSINPALTGLTTANFSPATGVVTFDWNTSSGISLDPNAVLFSICFNKLTDNPTSVSIGGTPTAIEIADSNGDLVAFNGTTGQVTCDPVLPLMFGQVDVVNLTCANEPIGSITIVSMVNGTGPYTYQWSIPGASGASITGLGAATVSVTVTDTSNGMTVSGTYNVTSPPAITTSVDDITNILCAGESTGSIVISASGGVQPFLYEWSGTLPDGPTQTGLPAGSYSVTITDANGCQETLNNILINELAASIVLTGNVTAIPGDGNPGNINLSVAGGMPGYTYSWTGPNGYTFTGEDPNNITVAGEYCVTVTDAFNCTEAICFDICESLRLVTFGISDACPGGSNGDVGITISGGCCPDMNTYRWVNLATNLEVSIMQDLANQPAGNYRVTITDCTGISISADFTIGENDAIGIAGTVVDVMSSNNGSVTITASGGSGSGYSYQWEGPNAYSSTMQNISGLTNGTYCVTVTDGAGCTESDCFVVNPAPPVVIQEEPTNVSCPGDEDGCIFLAIGGGQQPMTVTLNDGTEDIGPFNVPPSGQVEICNLSAGAYTYRIMDNGIGDVTGDFTIATPDPLADMAVVFNDTEDAGGSGGVVVTVSGGTGSPQITWNGYPSGTTVNMVNGPTTITGTIEDVNGCTLPISYTILQLTEEANVTNAGCADSANGAITVIADGATEPYTYNWATGQMTATIENLMPGIYTVTVTDATGANLVRNYEITAQSDYSVSADVVALDCFNSTDGEILVFVDNNGAPSNYTYEFELNGAVVATNSNGMLLNAAPGDYTINVVDDFTCAQTVTVTLTAPPVINVPAIVDRISCDEEKDGRIELNPAGGTPPYSYDWSTGQNTRVIGGLSPDTYTVTVTDANGCVFINSYEVEEAMPIIVTIQTTPQTDADNCNGTAVAIVLGGQPPYSYEWFNVPGKPDEGTIDSLCAGTYMLQVTDANGCTSGVVTGSVADERFDCFEERVVITPDGNGSNDEFIIFCAESLTNNHLEIYNRWGQLVYEVDGYMNDWEGTSQNGDQLPAGPYYWVLDYSSPGSGEPLQKRGSLTIVRDN